MKRKYRWIIALPPELFLNKLDESRKDGYRISIKGNKTVIQKPRYIFGNTIPVKFQVSFFAKLIPNEAGLFIEGNFGAPGLFYSGFLLLHFLFSLVFLLQSDFYQKDLVSYFIILIIQIVSVFIIFRFLVILSKKVFQKENQAVISLLDSIQAECSHQGEKET